MASLKEVKGRIASVISTQQITKAMKMVAAAKLRRSQDRIMQMRPFSQKLSVLLQSLSLGDSEQDWYNTVRDEKKILIITISSDRGLCGSFNSVIIKSTLKLIKEKYAEQHQRGDVVIMPIGKKAFEYFSKRKYKVENKYWNLFHELSFDRVSEAGQFLMDVYKKGEFDKIEVVYNEFKNVATQILRIEQFLPVPPQENVEIKDPNYIYQPNREEIISGMIPKALKVQLFKSILDSNAAENGARMTAMDKATENAGELLKELRLTYNRTRQAAITKEILEIVAGAEALKSA